MIETILIASLFCCGLRAITEEGFLLYFLRKPFLFLEDVALEKNLNGKILHILMKPIILCVICYGSFWGGLVFIYFNGLHYDLLPHLLIHCVGVSFLNGLLYSAYNNMQ